MMLDAILPMFRIQRDKDKDHDDCKWHFSREHCIQLKTGLAGIAHRRTDLPMSHAQCVQGNYVRLN